MWHAGHKDWQVDTSALCAGGNQSGQLPHIRSLDMPTQYLQPCLPSVSASTVSVCTLALGPPAQWLRSHPRYG